MRSTRGTQDSAGAQPAFQVLARAHEAEGIGAESISRCAAHAIRSIQSSQGSLGGCAEAREPRPPTVVIQLLGLTHKSSSSLMVEPLIAATQIFDHMQQPDLPRVEQICCLITTTSGALRRSVGSARRCITSGLD